MTERLTLDLRNIQQAKPELTTAWNWVRAMLAAGHRLSLSIKPQTRSDAQNRVLHSRINDIAKQCTWAGKKWDSEDFKRLLTAAWCRTRNESAELVPSLDGHGFDVIYRRTSKLTRAECADLSEYIMAWGSQQGVNWCAASLCGDVETGEILELAN